MISDHRPLWLKRLFGAIEHWYVEHRLRPHFDAMGNYPMVLKPWNVRVSGRHIRAGDHLHIISDPDRRVSFSTWHFNDHQGQITLGNNVLVCPGCRFDSASQINIGDNCMFAAGAYITDADWHDIYDRTRVVGQTQPVTLEQNVWIGDGTTVCKGVTIGENSIIGAGSVVTSDIPANVIAAGNPAQVIRDLDPNKPLTTRSSLFEDPQGLQLQLDQIDAYVLTPNTVLGWLRVKLWPRRGD